MKTGGESFKRADRVGEAIKAEIAHIIAKKVKDPRVGFLTVTSVHVTDDLRMARIYIAPSIQDSGESVLENLSRAAGFIRKELGKALQLRYVPELVFKLESESPLQVLELLDQIKKREVEVLRDDHDQ